MKGLYGILGAICIAGAMPSATPGGEPDAISIITNIKSPQDLLFPHFPRQYCVPVTLSGTIAEEMRHALDSVNTDPPEYRERFDGKTFNLILANGNYSAKTRELLSGILNPVEIIDIILASIVKYREGEKYRELVGETTIDKESGTHNGRPAFIIRLTPRGDRFGYSYRDMGALVHESWLTKLVLTIDAASNIVYELTATKHSRMYEAGAAEPPSSAHTDHRYVFSYETRDDIHLPRRLTVSFNDTEVLSIEASYRKQDIFYVFDTKKICSSLQGTPACLNVGYGDYRFGLCDTLSRQSKSTSKNYGRNLERASALSREAAEKLRRGKISDCVRVLRKLVERYGDTPQAVEARRLLDQLPGGLQ